MNKFLICITFSLALLSTGCLKVNTNPLPSFYDVEEGVASRTGHSIYWDTSLDENKIHAYIEEALSCELTPELAIDIALLNNRELQATYEELGIAKAQLVQAGLLRNPIFDFQYRFSTQSGISNLIDLGILQNFLEIVLLPLKKRSAGKELEATKARVTARVLDVIAQTQIAFYELQAFENIWDLKNKILLASECAYEMASRMSEAGNIKDLELSEMRSDYEQTKIEVANLEVNILEAREKLNILMGLWGCQICWTSSPCLPEIDRCFEWSDVENCAIANSVDLQIARAHIYASAAEMGVDTARIVFPEFDAGASAEREDGIWYVGPAFALAIPFFDFGQANSATAQSEIFRQWNLYTDLAIKIRSAARTARFRTLNAERQVCYYEEILVPLAKEITAQTLLQNNAMQIGVFVLLNAKKNELEREIESVEVQREYWIARTELEFLLNGLWIQHNKL